MDPGCIKELKEMICTKVWAKTLPMQDCTKSTSGYSASRGYIFAEGAGVRKVPSADNRSIFYRACVKFVMRFASKINRQVCRQMARVSRELKNCFNSDLLRKIHARLTQCSKLVKNRKKPVFFNLFVQISGRI